MSVPPTPSRSAASPQEQPSLETLIQRAHDLRELGTPESLRAAIPAYDEALDAFEKLALPESPASINQNASLWMKRGITLLTLGDRGALTEAIQCFDRAIELRSRLKLTESPWYRWLLAAGWLNRADALTRLGSPAEIEEAIRHYDLAIVHLQVLPLHQEPRFRWRLAVAWLNRGLSCQALDPSRDAAQALRCFDNCIALFRQAQNLTRADDRRTLAAAWFNRANVLVQTDVSACRQAAMAALELTRPEEGSDRTLAEVGIKARHVLCRALAELLETPRVDHRQADEWILEATDAVEESLQLTREWEARGETRFRPFLEQMFHFGALIYRAFQPHFLAEFLNEGQNSVFTEAMHQAARKALSQAAAQIRGEGLARLNADSLQRLLGTLAALNESSERLERRQVSA